MTKAKTLAFVLALSVVVSVCVSCAPNKDAVVATVDGENIYKWELDLYFAQNSPWYEQINGTDLNSPKNKEEKKKYLQQLAEYLAGELACVQEAKKLGFDNLTAEELAETDKEFEETRAKSIAESMVEFASDKDPAARAEEKFQKTMADKNLSEEKVKQNINQNKVLGKLFNHLAGDKLVTEEELKEKYEELLASQQRDYAEKPELYGEQASGTIAYIPPGYIRVKHILIGHDSETLAKLQQEQQDLNNIYAQFVQAALTDGEDTPSARQAGAEVDKAEKAIQKDMDASTEKLRPRAEEALAKLNAGEDFDALLETYNTDPGMQQFPAKRDGYYMCKESDFVDEFKDAAFELQSVGDTTGLVQSFYGFHIIKLLENVESRVVPYDEVREKIRFEMQGNMDGVSGMEIRRKLLNEREVKYFPENF